MTKGITAHLEWLKTPEGQVHLEEFHRKREEKELRKTAIQTKWNLLFQRNYIRKGNFEELVSRLISEHDDGYCEKCYKEGFQPYPNEELSALFTFVENKGIEVKRKKLCKDLREIFDTFSTQVYEFEEYLFVKFWGQGVAHQIWKGDKCLLSGI